MPHKIRIIVLLLTGFCSALQAEDYIPTHKSDFKKALKLTEKISPYFGQDYSEEERLLATTIVFPEMMRYSGSGDCMEAAATQLFYSCGSSKMNHSIGYFQMKPIFAREIELQISRSMELQKKYPLIAFDGKEDSFSDRSKRVKRLRNVKYQVEYLKAFVEIYTQKYGLENKQVQDKIRILATAYNAGPRSLELLEEIAKVPAYPKGTRKTGSNWIYWEVASEYYFFISSAAEDISPAIF